MFSKRTDWKLTHNRFTEAQRELEKSGSAVFDLTVSNPTRTGVQHDESIFQALLNPKALDYDPHPKGMLSAREAVANYYREQYREGDFDPESLILTTSTSEGYSYIFRLLCNPEDEILVPKPSYPLFEFLADLQDVKQVPYPLLYDHGWQIDFPSLHKALTPKTRAIVLVHPNNPTGSFVNPSEQSALNDFCNEHGLALIVDEVFLDYAHDGVRRQTFAANAKTLTFTLSGLSKISALPQMKLAWVVTSGPAEEVHAAMQRLEVIADTYLSVNAPIQLAMPVLLDQRRNVQSFLLNRLQENIQQLDLQISRQKTCTRLNVEGGWYAVLRVPVTQSDEDLAIAIIKNLSVLVHPGHFYDFPNDGYLVVSLITEPQEFSEGVKCVLNFLNQ
ncbi:MAG TPA: pyridoxal phosphate-dependent aminotransferase [Terriglobales bacterium]|nr:pyridoxal phosphate-dependent aminotransferase [Terriglobales bacterium]